MDEINLRQDYRKMAFSVYANSWVWEYEKLLEKDQIAPSYFALYRILPLITI